MKFWSYFFVFAFVAWLISQDNFSAIYEQYRGVFFGIFIFSGAMVMYRYIVAENKLGFFDTKKMLANLEYLHHLELAYLRKAVNEGTTTIVGDPRDPVLILLSERKIIKKIKNTHLLQENVAYCINDKVWEKIKHNPAFM